MKDPLVKKSLIEAILELREEVERHLQKNKYYVAISKLDEMLAAIRPLEAIEHRTNSPTNAKADQEQSLPTDVGRVEERAGDRSNLLSSGVSRPQ